MDWTIGFRRLRLKSQKIRFEIEVYDRGIKSYVCVDGADVLCHMFNELCTLNGGGEIRIKKLAQPRKFGTF